MKIIIPQSEGPKTFNFIEELAKNEQKQGVFICVSYLKEQGLTVEDVSENEKYFKTGADIIIHEPNGEILIDVKTDKRMSDPERPTNNIAVELIEICPESGEFYKEGCAFSKVNYIYYLDWYGKTLYKIPRKKFIEISYFKPRYSFSTYHNKKIKYFTLGILVPKEEFKEYQVSVDNSLI